jgi:hypothetical protein
MSRITTDMVRVFNQRLGTIGSPWRIPEGDYDGADYSQQVIVGDVNPTLAPFLVDQLSVTNLTPVDQSVVLGVNKRQKLTHSLSVTSSFKMGLATKLGFSIGIVKVEASLNLEQTWGSSNTETTEEEVLIQFEQPVIIPPKTLVTMQSIIQLQTVTNLPFELRVGLRDGRFGVVPKDTVPLYRYVGPDEHFYTTDFNELGEGRDGWVKEGVECHVSASQGPGLVPLYRYLTGSGYHFYTTNFNERGGDGLESIQCYVYPSAAPGTLPLHRYQKGDEHFYTTNFNELGNGRDGWNYEGIQAHVIPKSITDPALLRSVRELFPNDNDRMFIIPGQYRGQSTNRRIDILLRSEPATGIRSGRGKGPLERTPEHELAAVPILSDKEALRVSPGHLIDLRKSA